MAKDTKGPNQNIPEGKEMDVAAGTDTGKPAYLGDGEGNTESKNSGMSSDLQAHIGRQLRAMFDEVAQEPIPDRFLQLLNDLDKHGSDT